MRTSLQTRRGRRGLRLLLACLLLPPAASCVRQQRRITSGDGQVSQATSRGATNGARLVNLNTAGREELEKLPGIGPGLAARIVEHRGLYGRFRRAEHLMMVRGISDRRFRAFRALVTVE